MSEYNRPRDDEFDVQSDPIPLEQEVDATSPTDHYHHDSYVVGGSPEGQQYTTPGGSHGYVYTPDTLNRGGGIGKKLLIASCVMGGMLLVAGFCLLGAWLVLYHDHLGGDGAYGDDTAYAFEVPGTTDGLVIVEQEETDEGLENREHTLAEAEESTRVEETENTADTEYAESGLSQVGTEQVTLALAQETERIDVFETTAESSEETEACNSVVETTASLPETSGSSSDTEIDLLAGKATVTKKKPQRVDADHDGKPDVAFDSLGNVMTSAGERIFNTATVVARISAAVVEITTETVVQSNREQYTTVGAGSGVIIAKEGYIVTNHHVIDGADHLTVRLNDGTTFTATLVGTDEATDIAVIHIDAGAYDLTVAPLGSSYDLVAGEDIIAIGNPLGSLGGTVTEGIISATARHMNMDGNVMTLLQISAPVNPGNSGGGLFNLAGELVGIVNAKVTSESIEGLGFAIPVDIAYDIIGQLIEHRYVKGRVSMGMTVVDVTNSTIAYQYFGTWHTGVYITESTVSQDLQYGDLILSVNQQQISQMADIKPAIAGLSVGDTVEIVVYRGGEQITVSLVLAEYVPSYVTRAE